MVFQSDLKDRREFDVGGRGKFKGVLAFYAALLRRGLIFERLEGRVWSQFFEPIL